MNSWGERNRATCTEPIVAVKPAVSFLVDLNTKFPYTKKIGIVSESAISLGLCVVIELVCCWPGSQDIVLSIYQDKAYKRYKLRPIIAATHREDLKISLCLSQQPASNQWLGLRPRNTVAYSSPSQPHLGLDRYYWAIDLGPHPTSQSLSRQVLGVAFGYSQRSS